MTDPEVSDSPHAVPRALVTRPVRRSWAWLLPVFAIALAIFLVAQAWGGRGPLVTVQADDGHGVKAGDSVRYRGIHVGVIEDVRLGTELASVDLRVRLDPAAAPMARAGTRFWIVRPHLSLDSVQGLETVVGARYLAVDPAAEGGRRQTDFVALDEPPVAERLDPDGLEITLVAPARFSLAPGAPLTYRQIQIGTALSVGLSSDATSVEVRVYVRPAFVQLVREGTRFYETGGVEVGLSLTQGFSFDIGSIRSLLVGGIAMAIPEEPGTVVTTGHRFPLFAEPDEDWLEWSPPVPIGAESLPSAEAPPRPQRATLSWKTGRVLRRKKQRTGWVLPVAGGLIGPADLLQPADGARADTTVLAIGGDEHALAAAPAWSAKGLARIALELEGAEPYDLTRARELDIEPEESLVYGDPSAAPMALATSRLTATARGWQVDDAIAFDPSWNGACVLGRSDGALLGILLVDGDGARVAPLPAE